MGRSCLWGMQIYWVLTGRRLNPHKHHKSSETQKKGRCFAEANKTLTQGLTLLLCQLHKKLETGHIGLQSDVFVNYRISHDSLFSSQELSHLV